MGIVYNRAINRYKHCARTQFASDHRTGGELTLQSSEENVLVQKKVLTKKSKLRLHSLGYKLLA